VVDWSPPFSSLLWFECFLCKRFKPSFPFFFSCLAFPVCMSPSRDCFGFLFPSDFPIENLPFCLSVLLDDTDVSSPLADHEIALSLFGSFLIMMRPAPKHGFRFYLTLRKMTRDVFAQPPSTAHSPFEPFLLHPLFPQVTVVLGFVSGESPVQFPFCVFASSGVRLVSSFAP